MCKEIFKTYEGLENHTKKRHKGVYECNQCLSTFIHYMDLKQHMKVHTGEKRYICKVRATKLLLVIFLIIFYLTVFIFTFL